MLLHAVFLLLEAANLLQNRQAPPTTLATTSVGLATAAVAPAALATAIGASAVLDLCQSHLQPGQEVLLLGLSPGSRPGVRGWVGGCCLLRWWVGV